MIPKRVVERFPHGARSRGTDYYQRGRVTIDSAEAGVVKATVRGSERYGVQIDTTESRWKMYCDCPAAFDRGLCKHMWAVLLAADSRQLLARFEDADLEGAEKPAIPEWKRQLQQLRRRTGYEVEESPSVVPWPADREIIYLLNLDDSTGHGGAIIEVKTEPRFSFDDTMWLAAPDPADREIASLLLGSQDPWVSGGHRRTFRIPGNMYETTLRRIVESGRCFTHARERGRSEAPLRWDDGPAIDFRVRITPHLQNAWRVTGNLAGLDLIFTNGYAIDGNLVRRVNLHGAWRLLQALRDGPALVASDDELFDLAAELVLLGGTAVELPPGVNIERVTLPPRKRLRLRALDRPWRVQGLLDAQVGFDYAGLTVGLQRGEAALIDRERQRIIDRDFSFEQAALAELLELGFRREPNVGGPPRLTLAARMLAQTVSALAGAGWEVEAEGKRYRAADRKEAHVSSGVDWFELSATVQFGDQTAGLPRLLEALRKKQNTVVLDDGSIGIIPEEWVRRFTGIAGTAQLQEGQDVLRFTRAQTGLLDALLATVPEATFDETYDRIREQLRSFSHIQPEDPPPTFCGTLRPYQREGLGWMLFLQRFGLGGCLADDMGLGKTVQVLALLERRRAEGRGPSLVVVPRSLVFNWHDEAARFAPQLRVGESLDETGYDLLITTYGKLRRDAPRLRKIDFDYVILDESQAIKNATTASAKAARLLKGRHRLALSGTPIENRIEELWSLMDFLNPGMLGSSSAFRQFKSGENRELLSQAIKPLILRRTKAMVAPELPARIEQTLFVELDTEQRALYNELRDHYRNTLLARVEEVGIDKARFEVLEALLRLRQAALHPALIDARNGKHESAKLDMLESQLEDIVSEGHKALVFSQFTSFLDLVRQRLDKANVTYEYLDGRTQDRQARVQRFQSDTECPVFLISLRAGGYGLNLTAADYVFVLDPWWNPAVEAQAIDRAHRIGQQKTVFAMRLIAKDTVEEKVLELQEQKRALVEAILGEDSSGLGAIGREELELLLA